MLTIYHNPRCRKSRETLGIIESSGAMMEVVEYLKTPPTKGELKQIIEKLGIKPEGLIRKGEAIYKEKYKGKSLTDDEWIEAMEGNPILIERPIVVKGDKAVIGRPPENVKELL
ncbi:arsenate reductase (glutaredoxin) [Fulvivirga sp. 29W222]|uniref:Arsenate reductase (Glutaredoxin) n=1 Tax=Fulvivirga marina TaxID=2494733 RepID=A0A937KAB4_9BACT|nr:arsenate reductase (glutaredoxin) [Fulvivirga marina]MBL6445051.1 arsenate reductase (glutaredoxin) [Fulvivirga marina]